MRSKTSAIRTGNANSVAASLCEALVARTATTKAKIKQKSCRIQSESCSSILRIQLRLIFDNHTLDSAMLNWARVINTNSLASSQWRCHSLAGRVNNVRRRAQSETYRALLTSYDDRLTRLIGCYRTSLVSCACSRR